MWATSLCLDVPKSSSRTSKPYHMSKENHTLIGSLQVLCAEIAVCLSEAVAVFVHHACHAA